MGAYPRFRFDRRFDAPAVTAAPPPPPEPETDPADAPRHSDRDLHRALAAAEARGFAQGAEHGRTEAAEEAAASLDAAVAGTLEALSARLAAMDADLARAAAAVEAHGAAVVLALVRRLAPRLLATVAAAEVERLAGEALRAAGAAPSLHVRVAPPLADPVRRRLATLAGAAGAVTVAEDAGLAPGAVHAAWAAGAMSHDPAALLDTVTALTERIAAGLSLTDIPS